MFAHRTAVGQERWVSVGTSAHCTSGCIGEVPVQRRGLTKVQGALVATARPVLSLLPPSGAVAE